MCWVCVVGVCGVYVFVCVCVWCVSLWGGCCGGLFCVCGECWLCVCVCVCGVCVCGMGVRVCGLRVCV